MQRVVLHVVHAECALQIQATVCRSDHGITEANAVAVSPSRPWLVAVAVLDVKHCNDGVA